MKQLFKKIALTTASLVLLCVPCLVFIPSGAAFADSSCGGGNTAKGQVLQGVGEAGSGSCSATAATSLASTIVTILSILVGVLAVIMIIYGGFKYVTSSGDANKVASAKSTLIYALVGLAIAALAQVIVHDVLDTARKDSGSLISLVVEKSL
jgi:uncharacterized membrane protein